MTPYESVSDLNPSDFETFKKMKEEREEKESAREKEQEENKILEKYFPNKTFVPKILGDELIETHHFKSMYKRKVIYAYDNDAGVYNEDGTAKIGKLTTEKLKGIYKKNYLGEVISYITNSCPINENAIDDEYINLKNGLLNPMTQDFIEHTHEIFTITQLPIDYEKDAGCPLWLDFLEEKAVSYNEEVEGWKVKTIQEMFGYCFLKDQRYQKGFMFFGEKRTGKSTALNVLEELLGESGTTSLTLQKLTYDKYSPAYLFGKYANICAEITSQELKSTGMFKQITGGDSVTSGAKYQNDFKFKPFAKLIFSCNLIPGILSKDGAFYRRWIPIEFNEQIGEDEVDPNFFKERLVPELSGILNWALDGLKRLMETNKFSCPYSDEDVKDMYEKNSNSTQSFIYNEIDMEDDLTSLTKLVLVKQAYGLS